MSEGGYFLKPRKVYQSKIAHCNPCFREVWDWIIANARFSYLPKEEEGMEIGRGELITSTKEIQEALYWNKGQYKLTYSIKQIKDALLFLKNNESIITKRVGKLRLLIIIPKYEIYQNPENYKNFGKNSQKEKVSDDAGSGVLVNGMILNSGDKVPDNSYEGARHITDKVPDTKRQGAGWIFENITKPIDYKGDIKDKVPDNEEIRYQKNGDKVPDNSHEGARHVTQGTRLFAPQPNNEADSQKIKKPEVPDPLNNDYNNDIIYTQILKELKKEDRAAAAKIKFVSLDQNKVESGKNFDLKIAYWLWKQFRLLNPANKEFDKANVGSWAMEIMKLHVNDNRSYIEIAEVAKFLIFGDETMFWKYSISSANGFRKNFNKIFLAKQRKEQSGR